jgi:hypothetical protein
MGKNCGEVWGPGLLRLAKGLDHVWDTPLQKVQDMYRSCVSLDI